MGHHPIRINPPGDGLIVSDRSVSQGHPNPLATPDSPLQRTIANGRTRNRLQVMLSMLCTAVSLVLVACTNLETPPMTETFVPSFHFIDEETIFYIAKTARGTEMKTANIVSGETEVLMVPRFSDYSAVRTDDGVILIEVSSTTPRGRRTSTIVAAHPPEYRITHPLKSEESQRSQLTLVEGQAFYQKSTSYAGMWGGAPWQGFTLMKYDSGEEIELGELGAFPTWGSYAGKHLLPMTWYDKDINNVLTIFDTRTGAHFVGMHLAYVDSMALSPDGTTLLTVETQFGNAGRYKVMTLIDITSHHILDSYISDHTIRSAQFSPGGEIFFVEASSEFGSRLTTIENGDFKVVMKLE